MLLSAEDCLAYTGFAGTSIFLTLAAVLVIAGVALIGLSKSRRAGTVALVVSLMFMGFSVSVNSADSAQAANSCGQDSTAQSSSNNHSGGGSHKPSPEPTDTTTPEPTDTPTPDPTETPTPDPSTGLTIAFGPSDSGQYVWYCANGTEAGVCVSPSHTLDWTSFQAAGGVEEDYFIESSVLASENSGTGYFNISVKAPSSVPAGYKIGPGEGITCLQRATGSITGTANGVVSGDWTGAGAGWFNYWYTGCSLDPGVDSATFWAVAPSS